MTASRRRIAVVLFNLGGPDQPESVQPFLFNLFYDKAILRIRNPLRLFLATLISRKRAPEAMEIYANLGGGSPLLPNTQVQAAALEDGLQDLGDVRVFISMRYWHPMSDETAAAVKAFTPDLVVLLPLYPQYSTTTTASSHRVWREAARRHRLDCETRLICCYPEEDGLIEAMAARIRPALAAAAEHGRPRLLMSAHGLPERIVRDGDPYQWQCERTAAAVVDRLGITDLDWVLSYQSRVGPLKWIGPATEEEVERAGHDQVPLVVAPVAFVSEHSETLVELDIEYRELAAQCGVPAYHRVPTVDAEAAFIDGLARLARRTVKSDQAILSGAGARICPGRCGGCPNAVTALEEASIGLAAE